MIKYGLKLWSSNTVAEFQEAADLCTRKIFDFAEVYYDPDQEIDYDKLGLLKDCEVSIHATNSHGWHEFFLTDYHVAMWQNILKMADFFRTEKIVVHAGAVPHTFETFLENLKKIDDPRILVENMAGLDIYKHDMHGRTFEELQPIAQLKPICFDFEKAIKSACFQKIDYKDFILKCVNEFKPRYFHISGGDKNSPVDEHKDLMGVNFDVAWIRELLKSISEDEDMRLVFETAKKDGNLKNDVANLEYFKRV